MAKYRLLTRISDNRDELQWNNYNIEKYIDPPAPEISDNNYSTEVQSTLNSKILSLFTGSNIGIDDITSFSKSNNPPADNINYVRIDNNSSTPLYAWIDPESSTGIIYYTESTSIKLLNGYNLFYNYKSCKTIDVSNWDTSAITSFTGMFQNCTALKSLDLSNIDASKVRGMMSMFSDCSSLTSLNLTNFNPSNITTTNGMFYNCRLLKSLDLSGFNFSNCSDTSSMFYNCSSLTSLNLDNFNASEVTNMFNMFNGCRALTSLNVKHLDISSVTNMQNMFRDCSGLTSIIFQESLLDEFKFDTSKVINIQYMFSGCDDINYIKCNSETKSFIDDHYIEMVLLKTYTVELCSKRSNPCKTWIRPFYLKLDP